MKGKMCDALKRGSPTVLTILGAVGIIATPILAVKATPKALKLIEEDSKINHDGDAQAYTTEEAVRSAWHCYIPAATVGLSTLLCVCSANLFNKKQQASLAGAYALIDSSYKQYKGKLKEFYGEEANEKIVNAIEKEKCKDVQIYAGGFADTSTLDFEQGDEPEVKRTFYDKFSDRYFESTIDKVLQAEYHLNRNYILGGNIGANEFYKFLGLPDIENGDSIGWSCDETELVWIDFNHRLEILDDGMEVFVIEFVYDPYQGMPFE